MIIDIPDDESFIKELNKVIVMSHGQDPNLLTQDEIDKLVDEINEALGKNPGIKKMIEESGLETDCWHDWKSYKGFTESYDYCTKCPAKR